jgi:outer membrane biogenesis lipoprotein LolB
MHRAAFLVAALVLASCAITPAPMTLPSLEAAPAAFEMTGRLAVRLGERSDIAKLRWTHERAGDTWVISSPLGNEVARIEAGERGATLRRAGSPPESAADFASLTERLLGVPLDPVALAGWLHGGRSSMPGGWSVAVDETQRAGAIDIARRITASRGEVTVRLVVDEYRVLGN